MFRVISNICKEQPNVTKKLFITHGWAFLIVQSVKNLPANAGDLGSIPGSGRSPEKEMATHSSNLIWEISWTEEPDGL